MSPTRFYEQSEYHSAVRGFSSESFLDGGYPDAERQAAFFIPGHMTHAEAVGIAITPVCIAPVNSKFSDELTHRDFLGAIMQLGIERSCIGDIVIRDGSAYVFCLKAAADVLCRELVRVSHTSVSAEKTDISGLELKSTAVTENVNVASERADAVIAAVFRLSRGLAEELCREEKVFADGRIIAGSRKLVSGEKISVRGMGKFRYGGINGSTRKNRLYVVIERYV